MALYRDHVWHLTTQVCGVVPVQRTLIKMPHRDDWKRGCVNTGFFYSIHPISAADLKNFCNCLRFEFRVGDGEVVARFVPKAAAEVMDNPGGMYDTRRDEYMPEIILDVGTGSGAIALAVKKARPDAQVEATDASAAALLQRAKQAFDLIRRARRGRSTAGNWRKC